MCNVLMKVTSFDGNYPILYVPSNLGLPSDFNRVFYSIVLAKQIVLENSIMYLLHLISPPNYLYPTIIALFRSNGNCCLPIKGFVQFMDPETLDHLQEI